MSSPADTGHEAGPVEYAQWLGAPATNRVLISTDAACEADDQFAIVQALLSPTLDICGIVPEHFGTDRTPDSQRLSRSEVDTLLTLTGRDVPVADGAAAALSASDVPADSAGARMIIDQAHSGPGRLFITALGPLTTMASAILLDPSIVDEDVVLIWIGGLPYDDVQPLWPACYNLANDHLATNVVFGSGLTIWQVPMDVYASIGIGYAELFDRVRPCGDLGRYLADGLVAFNRDHHRIPIDGRILGDSPAIGIALNEHAARWTMRGPQTFPDIHTIADADHGAPVRTAISIDTRYILEDLFAKLRLFASLTA